MSSPVNWFKSKWTPGLAALSLLVLVYAGTLQQDIAGGRSDYVIDVGEIQIALNIWGTIHYTGYPLFTILSALLAKIGLLLGMTPAAAASASAALWSLLAAGIAYAILLRITNGQRSISALLILAFGLVETFWVHSVVAEVYSFSVFLVTLAFYLALKLAECWDKRLWLVLMFVLGASVAHHRLLLLLVPWIIVPAIPSLRKHQHIRLKWLVVSAVAFLLPFLAYLYLPLRAIQGSNWVYGKPATWDGFWAQFMGLEETSSLLRLPPNRQQWWMNIRSLIEQVENQVPLAALCLGITGLLWRTIDHFWTGISFLGAAFSVLAFTVVFPMAVWAPAMLMPCLLLLGFGLAYFIHRAAAFWAPAGWLGALSLTALAAIMFSHNLPFIWDLVRHPSAREVIDTLAPLQKSTLPDAPHVLALPWSGSYFAAAYGLMVTGELDGFELVDHRADFESIVNEHGAILTAAYNLGNWPLEWWSETLGSAHFSSAAPGVAVISREPIYKQTPATIDFDLGNGISISQVELIWLDASRIWATIYWKKTSTVESDYRVAVHLVSKVPPESGQDILDQADALNPVGGWYPISLWEMEEIVRDDYMLTVPENTLPTALRIAMYRVAQDGQFENSDWLTVVVPDRSSAD